MFIHKNRAKFFDFILPVVPIINSSNSLDKMLDRLKKYSFESKIDKQFLREASLYIDDMRLIHNIFNELAVYHERLNSEKFDVTKLLAMMIYKNVYPSDFENLHHGKGILFGICRIKHKLIKNYKSRLNDQANELKSLISHADAEMSRNERELIDTYLGHIITHVNQEFYGIVCQNQHVPLSQLTTLEQFKPLISETDIKIATASINNNYYRFHINKSFSQIEEEINPGVTFLGRIENITNKAENKKTELRQKIRHIEKEIDKISHLQIYQLLRADDTEINDLIENSEVGIGDTQLLVYLVKNGYLDDNYHLYTSNFHEGRLSKNDRDYLLTIRNFGQPNPLQIIDSPKEVCANMREEDFRNIYALNILLVDHLLETINTNPGHLKSIQNYISQNFEKAQEFLTAYIDSGKHLDQFIRKLSHEWPELATTAFTSANGAETISCILKYVDTAYICNSMNMENALTDYLSEYGQEVFVSSRIMPPDDYHALIQLNVHFKNLKSLDDNISLVEFSHNESLYTITENNVNYILDKFGIPHTDTSAKAKFANYTTILNSGSDKLKAYVKQNIQHYIESVFLSIPDNSMESEATIKILVNNKEINNELKEKILTSQHHVFETFDGIPESLWSHLLLDEKVHVSWDNISIFISNENNDRDIATELLGRIHITETLSKTRISPSHLGDTAATSLSSFICNNDDIDDGYYCELIKCIPYLYKTFPTNVGNNKNLCLAKENKVELSEESFSYALENSELTSILISNNIAQYLGHKEKYPIEDDVRELLIYSNIDNHYKLIILLDINPSSVIDNTNFSRHISNTLLNTDDYSQINDTILASAIVNTETLNKSIKLLIKIIPNWNEMITMDALARLPEPYCEISSYGKRPKLENNETNIILARLLKKKGFISSFKEDRSSIKINTFKSSDHCDE